MYAFEPLPLNLLFLRKHITINRCENVEVFDICIADKRGGMYFDDSKGSATGHLSGDGRLRVNADTLDNLIRTKKLNPPDFMKINAEGAEEQILQGGLNTLKKYKPGLLMTFHGEDLKNRCISILEQHGYDIHITAKDALYAL